MSSQRCAARSLRCGRTVSRKQNGAPGGARGLRGPFEPPLRSGGSRAADRPALRGRACPFVRTGLRIPFRGARVPRWRVCEARRQGRCASRRSTASLMRRLAPGSTGPRLMSARAAGVRTTKNIILPTARVKFSRGVKKDVDARCKAGHDRSSTPALRPSLLEKLKLYLPGVALCVGVTAVAKLLERAEVGIVGHLYLEGLVIAILLGVAIRAFWTPGLAWARGIAFSREDAARDRGRAARRLDQRRAGVGARAAAADRHCDRGRDRDRVKLRALPRARRCRAGWPCWSPAATRSAATRQSRRSRR